ncbi:hypothetical protein CHS0354_019447 [Potamilus streckersoni]|uniref:Uncharacterized protein n=1 Tax=Potamilus streckersoni TaxID=2493646 RepID=A0AAE0VVZ9_9BIVA|nr:hypothetical protein CHS0354_019447 [Potamilus streckersoni]
MKTENDGSHDRDEDLPATQILDDRVLKDVVAYVEVRSTNDNRSQAICKELEALGARVSKKFTDDVTHVIYKEGSKRTRNKAQKREVPMVSVLWIESCKHNQTHVSERLYPAILQENKGTPIILTRLKKAKSMQPKTFEDDLASSAERCLKKRRKGELDKLKSNENTPKFSPRLILALDTQHLSPEEGFVRTPVRLTIPDTPLSMRRKMERLKQAKINGSCTSPDDDEIQSSGEREPLQRQLFVQQPELISCEQTTGPVGTWYSGQTGPVLHKPEHADIGPGFDYSHDSGYKTLAPDIMNHIHYINHIHSSSFAVLTYVLQNYTSDFSVSTIDPERQAAVLSQNISCTECDEDPVPAEVREKFETIKNMGNKDSQGKSRRTTISSLQHLSTCQSVTESCLKKSLGSQCSENASTPPVINKAFNECTEDMNTNDIIDKHSHAVEVEIHRCKENVKVGQINKEENQKITSQPIVTENKKTLKKKLLYVKDTVTPPAMLIEPTKCSQYPSPALANIAVKGKRGRARGNSNTSIDTDGMTGYKRCQETGNNGVRKRKLNILEEDDNDSSCEQSNKKQNLNLQKSETCVSKEDNSGKSKCDEISVQKETEIIKSNITDNATMTDHNSFLSSTPETTIGLTLSIRETTLGLSMSTAFTDTTMPSILMPPRPSIDEFRLKRKKLRGMRQPFNDKNTENENLLGSDTFHNSDCRKCENACVCERSSQLKTHDSSLFGIKRPTLVMTSLHSCEQDVVIAVVKKLGGFIITEKVCETTTHVVSGEPRRTLNILHGLARGCWIISKDWVLHSLEAGRWLNENAFECYSDFPACRMTRETRERGLPVAARELFAELGHIFISNKTVPSRKHLIPLIKVCGGQVTSNLSKARLYLGSDFHPDVMSLKPLWILESFYLTSAQFPCEEYLIVIMDLRSGYIAILMIYVTFDVFTRYLVHGGNESTTTEGIASLTSTKLVELTTSLGTVQVNISSTIISSLGTPVSSNASMFSTTLGESGTSIPSTTFDASGTSIPSTTLDASGTSIPSTTFDASGTSIPSTTLSAIGASDSTSLTTKSSSTTTASGAVLFADIAPVNNSSTKFSNLVAADANTTLSASVASISSTTLSTIGTSTLLTTKSSSTTMASGAVQVAGTTPVNNSSTKFSDLVAAVANTTPSASVTFISSTILSTIGTSTLLTAKSSSTATTLQAVQQTEFSKELQTHCQDLNTPCMNNGTCTPEGTCLCLSSWTGRRCQYPCSLDACPSPKDVCIIDGTCNINGTAFCHNSTFCICFLGWNGSMCNISVCDNYYCYNGGKCQNNSGIAVCECVKGVTGHHCEHNMEYSCLNMSSGAVDRIISCIDNTGYYTLVCKPEWTGKNCETPINRTEFCTSNKCKSQHMGYCNAVCERGNCSQEYITPNATYAPTQCLFTLRNPFDMCNKSNCTEEFANGFCDDSCNNEACLFDGYDCIGGRDFLEDCSPYFITPCAYNLTFDGKCNTECNTTDCLYDGFDCALSGLSPLPGQLVIQMPSIHRNKNFVRKIGLLLRSGVNKTYSYKMNDKDVFAEYLTLTCSGLVNKKCFTSIQSAAKFLAAYVAKLEVSDLFVTDIFACEDGYYGDQGCQSQCSKGCKNSTSREVCHKYTGDCLDGCIDEFYGSMCDKKCNDNCGEGVGRRCHEDSGTCTYQCKKDYHGSKCDKNCNDKCLSSCYANGTCIGGCQGNLSYGFNCEEKCPTGCQNSTCDHLGKCPACMIGYYGDNCMEPCPKGCFEGCSQATGDCIICKSRHHGKKCEAGDVLHSKHQEGDPGKRDYTGVIVGVTASVFIIAGAILIAFLCWRRHQSGDYILDEEAGTKTNANLEAVTTVQDQNSHMANFASSKDAVDLDDMHDNSVYVGRSQASSVKFTDHEELTENSPETMLGTNYHSQIQPSEEITLTTDLDESNEKFVNSGRVDLNLPPPEYAAEIRDIDDQSSDDQEDAVARNSGLLVAGGAPLAASEASLLSKDTLDEPPQSDDEPPQPDDQFMFEDGNLPQVTEADFKKGNISDEEEEEEETRKSRSSSSSSSSDNN